ncbi:tetratricopeptide repeat protein [Gymnodinialimonas sp.]
MDDRPFTLRPDRRDILINGAPAPLGARAFDVLAYLDAHSDRVVSKRELLEQVWGGLAVEEGNLSVQISTLRKVLGSRAIATVPGVGYKLAGGAPVPPASGPALPDKPSLAVLPFANLTGDPANDYLVDGIVTDLISSLSRISGIFVIAATSSFALKGQVVQLRDVGTSLGVRYVLEGSIQKAAGTFRIAVQLVEAESSRTIWSQRFTGSEAEIFELQDRITEEVAAAVEPEVLRAESGRAAIKPTDDLQAYDLCMQAFPYVQRLTTPDDFETAKALLTRALERDPGYAQAKALICRITMVARSARWLTIDKARATLPLAESVLTDPRNDALALAFAGHAIAFMGSDPARAKRILDQAYALNPNSSHVLNAAGWVHVYADDYETAIDRFSRSIRINPLDPIIGQARCGLGIALVQAERVAEAIVVLEQAYAEAPEYPTVFTALVWAYWLEGRLEQVEHFGRKMLACDPGMTISGHFNSIPFVMTPRLRTIEGAFRHLGIPD